MFIVDRISRQAVVDCTPRAYFGGTTVVRGEQAAMHRWEFTITGNDDALDIPPRALLKAHTRTLHTSVRGHLIRSYSSDDVRVALMNADTDDTAIVDGSAVISARGGRGGAQIRFTVRKLAIGEPFNAIPSTAEPVHTPLRRNSSTEENSALTGQSRRVRARQCLQLLADSYRAAASHRARSRELLSQARAVDAATVNVVAGALADGTMPAPGTTEWRVFADRVCEQIHSNATPEMKTR